MTDLDLVLESHVPISERTYYRMGGTARAFARCASFAEARAAVLWARARGLPVAVLGGGSNSVFADGEFEGLVIALDRMSAWHWERPDVLWLEAGVTNTEVAEICLEAGRKGASWMYRMPGQLGATVRMNARCYGGEISHIVREVVTLDTRGSLRVHAGASLFIGYKNTVLMSVPEIVLGVRLALPETGDRAAILEHMLECERDRHGKHHFDLPSCGSTFKNNYAVGKPSGRVFDECGLKGAAQGEAEVSAFHANFVWNRGRARTRDMLELTARMRATALQVAHADLELEVQPIGVFDDDLYARCAMDRLGPAVDSGDVATGGKWVGLLWHPAWPDASPAFPFAVFASPFFELFHTPGAGLCDVHVRVSQLRSLADARANPGAPFLEWRTSGPLDAFPVRADRPGEFQDGLWTASVSEIFFAHADRPAESYFEFEMTPDGAWIALAFDGVRKRDGAHAVPDQALWRDVERFVDDGAFGMRFSFSRLAPLIVDGRLRLQCALSMGGARYFIAPDWKSADRPGETWDEGRAPDVKADFHQPRRFWEITLV